MNGETVNSDRPISELRFQTLVRLSPAGIYLTDTAGRCTYVNASWCRMAGMTAEEALGDGWISGIHLEDRPRVAAQWKETISKQEPWGLEYRMQTPDGVTTWVYGQATGLTAASGKVIGYVGINTDITKRKQAEEALRESKQRFDQLLSAVTSYRYHVQLSDGWPPKTEHSVGCLPTTGYTPEEYRKDPYLWIKIVDPSDLNLVRTHVQKVLEGQRVPPLEHRIRHKNGSLRWIRDTIISQFDDRGALLSYDGLVEDITDRKLSELRFWHVLEAAPDAMLVVDQQGKITLANAQAEHVFGFTRQELLQQPIELLVPKAEREQHILHRQQYMGNPEVRPMSDRPELFALRKDGSLFPAEISLSPLPIEDGVVVAAAIRDATQRKQTEEALRSGLQIQSTLNTLLELSLQPIGLEEQLRQMLAVLCEVSWLGTESRGALFLLNEENGQLELMVEQGLPESLRAYCQVHPLCPSAVKSHSIIFCNSLFEVPEEHREKVDSQPHYCVPIVAETRSIGLLSVFVTPGHEPSVDDVKFLSAVANVVAGMIQRGRAEESLRDSEERFDLAVRGTDAGIWDWNLATNKVYFSPRWKSILGYNEDEILDNFDEWQQRLHPDDEERAVQTLRDYMEGRTSDYELEHRLRHKDGNFRWILARGALVRDKLGRPHRMVGSHLDITARKRAEQDALKRVSQLMAAQRIQEHLLPHGAPKVPGFDIAGSLIPAEFAAGDYFDFLRLPDGSLLVIVGDVAGKGFSSALVMAATSAHLRSFIEHHENIREILEHTNSIMCKELEETRFVTLFMLHLKERSRMFHFINAGHPSGIVLDQAGNITQELCSNAMPLAVSPDAEFPIGGPGWLSPGDSVVLITDGISEARNADGEFFGTERLLEVIRNNLTRRADEIISCLQEAVTQYTGRPHPEDDITSVIIRVQDDADSLLPESPAAAEPLGE